MPDRRRLLAAIALTSVAVGLLLRIGLLRVYAPTGTGLLGAIACCLSGAVLDLLVSAVVLAPAALLLALSGGQSLASPRLRYVLLSLACAAMVFGAAVEWFFF